MTMSLYRKNLLIAFCKTCGSYGIPAEEKVYDPSSGKNYYVCRDCHTVHSEIEVSMVQVVDGQTWSEKHLVKDYKLNVPFKGGK
jgi:Zn-finger protein